MPQNEQNIPTHISQQFDQELEEVRNKVLKMGGTVEKQVADGLNALLNSDSELGVKVSSSDFKVNAQEVQIDEDCVGILARRQPAAGDLRLVVTIIKTITDLERIGDEAEKLGRIAVKLTEKGVQPNEYTKLRHLGEHVKSMLRDALNAFARMETEQALEIIDRDIVINQEFEAISRQLITNMMEDPRNIKDSLRVTWCARALERIGDHSKNICENVIYLVLGKDIRHTS